MTSEPDLRYMIVDDEPMAHRVIIGYCRALPSMELVNQSYDAFQALEYLRNHQVDLIFLDLNMPDLGGFAFLRTLSNPPEIIVTTAHEEHALEGYELDVRDYLVKPFRMERFLTAVNKVKKPRLASPQPMPAPASAEPRVLVVKGDKKHHRINQSDILFLEACGNYCFVVTATQKIMTHQSLSQMTEALLEPAFMRVHKSYVVAIQKITAVGPSGLEIGDIQIPIGQTYKSQIAQILK